MTTFTIIVPVYNSAHTLERCVNSIVSASGDDAQIILIDDGSKDNSLETCLHLSQKFSTVVCLHNEHNRGVSYTRNVGIDAAIGKYLLFVDSDDWVDLDYVSAFRQSIDEKNNFAICGYINHDEKYNDRTDIFSMNEFEGKKTVSLKENIEKLYHLRLLQQLWNKVFLTDIVRKHGIRFDEDISIGEDSRFILEYIKHSGIEEVTLINRPLYHYMRDQNSSLMHSIGYKHLQSSLDDIRNLYEIIGLPNKIIEEKLRNDRQQLIENCAYMIMHNVSMTGYEKRKLVLALDKKQGKSLYRNNRIIIWKEFVLKQMRKFGLR